MANRSEEYYVKVQDGQLQCHMWHNSGFGDSKIGMVILHPWATLGGSMDDPVVLGIFNAAKQSGLFNCVVRYNARGVAKSQGPRKGGILVDIQDCHALCHHLLTDIYNPPAHIYLVGYSYGSCVAASTLHLSPQVVGYVSIGFPLGFLSRLFLRSRSHWEALSSPAVAAVPKLLVAGTNDQFTSLATYSELVQELRGRGGAVSEQGVVGIDVKVMDGCDHFFVGRCRDVGAAVVQWVGRQEEVRAGGIKGAVAAVAGVAAEGQGGQLGQQQRSSAV